MNMKKIIALLLALTVLGVLFGACNSSTQQSSQEPSASEPQVEAPVDDTDEDVLEPDDPEDLVDGGATLDRIRAAGKLIMLTNAAFPPFEYLGDDNEIVGVDAEIAAAIAAEIGVDLEIVDMDFDGIPMAVSSGQGDLGVAGITAREDRRQVVDFSINYVETTQLIIVPEQGTDIATPDDLEGKSIGVQMGTTGDLFASEIEGAEIVRFKTGPDAGLALANGQIDCVIIDAMPAEMIVNANSGLTLLEDPFTEEEYAIAIAKNSEDLKAVVDSVLTRMLDDGSIDALIEKHMEAIGE